MKMLLFALAMWTLAEFIYLSLAGPHYLATYSFMANVGISPFFVVLSYTCLVSGMVAFATDAWKGALYGVAVYGVFNFTNLALFPDFHRILALQDLAWGVFACALFGGLRQVFSPT